MKDVAMTVKELIEILETMPQDAEVFISDYEDNTKGVEVILQKDGKVELEGKLAVNM